MDSNRSHPSYSDDFEQDIESPQNSPRSEEKVEIKVFKSPAGCGSITVQPKRVLKNAPMVKSTQPTKKKSSGRTLSELSVLSKKTQSPDSGRSPGGRKGSNSNLVKAKKGKSISSVKPSKPNDSNTSLGGQMLPIMRAKALAQEKIDPRDVPASVAASASSLSMLNLQRNLSGGTASTIRRVLAHTAIKEKSYPSAKYKTYTSPGINKNGGSRGYTRVPTFQGGYAKANYVAQRVASAKRMTIMDLKSKIKLLEDEIEKLKKENRFLNHLHHRQDNALRRWEGKDAELPRLLNQHKDEIRSLQDQLRRTQQNSREFSEKLSGRDKKILRLENELEKLRALVHEEHLQDRHTLQEELDITRMNLAGAEKRIREYMRHVDILEKNHRHQLAAEERKLIKVNTHTYELQQIVTNLKLALRNKDRMLNYIQMRSSGRNLIRAFHAERGGPEEGLYGSSRMTYHPPVQKSRSFDFGNSRCNTPYLEDSNREKYIDYVPGKRNSLDEGAQRRKQEKENESRKSNKEKRSHSVESKLSASSHSKRTVTHSNSNTKSRTVAPESLIVGLSRGTETAKTTKKDKSLKSETIIKPILKASKKTDGKRKRNDKMSETHKSSAVEDKQLSRKKDSEAASKNAGKVAIANKSKELIYEGSSVGFKYEGPFVKEKSRKQESTEILYSATTDKLSEHSLTESPSSYSTNTKSSTSASSARTEIISNIDILSARIRESCIKVAPPEEKHISSRSRTEEDEAKTLTAHSTPRGDVQQHLIKDYQDIPNPPIAGPGGDNGNTHTQSHLLGPIILNATPVISLSNNAEQMSSQSYQTGYVQQPIQILTGEVQDLNSPNSHASYAGSPRPQQYSVNIPTVSGPSQPPQYQLNQSNTNNTNTPNNSQTNSYAQIGDSVLSQLLNSTNNSPQEQQQQQSLQSGTFQYSPRYAQSYPTTTYSLVSTEPQPSVLGAFHQETQLTAQQLQQQQQQNAMRYPIDFQYFSFATAGQDQISAQSNPTNLALIQTSPVYDSSQTPLSSRSNNYAQGNYYSPAPTSQQQSTFPRVGYYSSRTANGDNVDQNSSSANKANQPTSGYNPSYYANLGSWK